MSVKWFRGAAEKKRKKRVRDKPRPPRVPKPSVRKVFRGPKRPGVWPQELTVKRPFVHADGCGCGMNRSSAVVRDDRTASVINDLVQRAELSGFPREKCTVWWEAPGGRSCAVTEQSTGYPICEYWSQQAPESRPWTFDQFASMVNEVSVNILGIEPNMTAMSHPNCTCLLHIRFVHGTDPERYYEYRVKASGVIPGVDKSEEFKSSSDVGANDFPPVDRSKLNSIQMKARESPEAMVFLSPQFDVFRRVEWTSFAGEITERLRAGESPDIILDAYEGPLSAAHVETQRKECISDLKQGKPPRPENLINKILFTAQAIIVELSEEPEFSWIKGKFRPRDYKIAVPEVGPGLVEGPEKEAPEEAKPAAPAPEEAPAQVEAAPEVTP